MANKLIMKKSSVASKVPLGTDLDVGELAVNLVDQKLYSKKADGTVVLVGSGLGGAGDVQGPASSTDNAIVRFDQTTGKIIQNSSATIDDSGNLFPSSNRSSGTAADRMPVGTTAQRPASPAAGDCRFNLTTGFFEGYNGTRWVRLDAEGSVAIEYLVLAGGGGGGTARGGGGGAGGYRSSVSGESSGGGASAESKYQAFVGQSYTVTVGAGGGANASGSNSVFADVVSTGGGRGGDNSGSSAVGGSGGGGGGGSPYPNGSSGTSFQGYAGGNGYPSAQDPAGGGGGAAQAGQTITSGVTGGKGGDGVSSSITGSSVTRGGGGGGGVYSTGGVGGAGGSGGGGSGAASGNGGSGTTNLGAGGGGGPNSGGVGGSGGSGVVIFRYPSSYSITVSAGLTSSTSTVGSNKVTTITAGTGTVFWSFA